MTPSYRTGFTTDDPDAFIRSPLSHVCVRLEDPEFGLGDDLSPDDFTIESFEFERGDDYAEVMVEVTPNG